MRQGDATQSAVYLFGILEAFRFLSGDFLQVPRLLQPGMGTIVPAPVAQGGAAANLIQPSRQTSSANPATGFPCTP